MSSECPPRPNGFLRVPEEDEDLGLGREASFNNTNTFLLCHDKHEYCDPTTAVR